MKQFWQTFQKVDRKLDQMVPLLLILLIYFLIKLPSFAEPYWYGDEAIYLTIGTALRHGSRLYLDIVDHKTPIIYFLAMVPNQVWFRVLGFMANLGIILAFWKVSQRILVSTKVRWGFVAALTLALNLPALEGNIPNGETFVLFFISLALLFFWRSQVGQSLHQKAITNVKNIEAAGMFAAGVLASLGILTKVPALFDVLAIGFGFWLAFLLHHTSLERKHWKLVIGDLAFFGLGVVAPILFSIVYFWLRGSGQAYLEFGLLYNFRYAGNWQLPFQQPVLVWLFSLTGKAVVLGGVLLLLSILVWVKRLPAVISWSLGWLFLTLLASTLSNRPYPHYFLQLVPPVCLTFALAIDTIRQWWPKRNIKNHHFDLQHILLPLLLAVTSLLLVIASVRLLQVPAYPTVGYYQRFVRVVTGQDSWEAYRNSFDQSVQENYKAAKLLRRDPDDYLFIWGTNPLLYAVSQKIPTGRFTVLFHIRDFHAEAETIQSFRDKKPMYAVVMRNEEIPPELYNILSQDYMVNSEYQFFTLWRRTNRLAN